MTEMPFFSIIVPIYKVEKYLPQCIESLLAQNFDDFEIILVDDGSPDNCPKICDDYASKSSKIKVVHKPNGGLSDARNAGVAVSSGRYITFSDSDDFWRGDNVLSGVRRVIEQNNFPDIIVSDFIKYYEKTDKYLEPSVHCKEELNGKTKQEILENLYFCQADMKMSACQKFAFRELLTDVPFEKGLLSEDIDWSLEIYPRAKSIAVYPEPYYCYRQQREGSITNTASKRSFDSLMYIIDKWEKKIPLLPIPTEEKSIYHGYLAYQLAITMNIYCNLERSEKPKALETIKHHLNLFSYPCNHKTQKVRRLLSLIGLKHTCIFLGLFRKLRSSLTLG